MAFKLYLLGGARLESSGLPVTGRATQRRRLALLALLATAPRRTLTRERIVAYLWPDHSPDAGRRLLSEAVYVLRRALGDETILTAGDELTLNASVETDIDEFRAALAAGNQGRAAEAYAGPFLDGWYVRDAPEFERWTETERARFASDHDKALRELARGSEEAGDWQSAARWWRSVVRLDPYSSAAVQQAARALVAAGERAAALQILSTHEATLLAELGVGPDEDFVELARLIREGKVGLHRVAPGPLALTARSTYPVAEVPEARDAHVSRASSAGASAAAAWLPPSRTLARTARAVGIMSLFGLGLWAAAAQRRGAATDRNSQADTLEHSNRRRIAVMYFEDHTSGRTLGYLADGLTEYLIGELSRAPGLHVVSPDAVRRLRGISIDSVTRSFHVGTIVQARVEASGTHVRVVGRLVDAATEEQVGSLVVEAPKGETIALEDQLSGQMAVQIARWVGQAVHVSEARAAAANRDRNRAMELVLRAEQLRKMAEDARVRSRRDSSEVSAARNGLAQADSLLSVAERLDRTWALPAVERGRIALSAGTLESGTARVLALSAGLGHAERAIAVLELGTATDSALLARAFFVRGLVRLRSATAVQTFRRESTTIRLGESDLERAVAFEPSLAPAWAALALPRWLRGDFAGVDSAASRAFESDEFLEEAPDIIGWAWHAANSNGDYGTAMRWCARGHQLMPDDWHFIECELTIMRLDAAGISGRRPDTARAWALVRELDRIDPPSRARVSGHPYSPIYRRMVAAMVTAAAGDRPRARSALARAEAEVRGNEELSTDLQYDAACLRFLLGDRPEAERALAEYLRARPDLAGFIQRDATAQRLRGR